MAMVHLDIEQAERLVASSDAARWDGWDIVIHRPQQAAWMKKDGRFHNGKWGFETVVKVTTSGTWGVPEKYVNDRVRSPRS